MSISIIKWRAAMLICQAAVPYMLAQQHPCSASERLLVGGYMDVLFHADRWEQLRLSLGSARSLCVTSGGQRTCKLCMGFVFGLPHLLASCPALAGERGAFLSQLGRAYAAKLSAAPCGDWPTMVLTPHADLVALGHTVVYGSEVMWSLEHA